MITKFKIFEKLNELPKIGDFVLLNAKTYQTQLWVDFITSNIGEIVDITKEHGGIANIYKVKFENAPEDIKKFFLNDKYNTKNIQIENFKYWSSNKNEIEKEIKKQIAQNKYNL